MKLLYKDIEDIKNAYKWYIADKDDYYLPITFEKSKQLIRKIQMGKMYTSDFIGVTKKKVSFIIIVDFINPSGVFFSNVNRYLVRFILGNYLRMEMYDLNDYKIIHKKSYNTKNSIDLFLQFATLVTSKGFVPVDTIESKFYNIDSKKIVFINNHYDYIKRNEFDVSGFVYDGGGFVRRLSATSNISISLKKNSKYIVTYSDSTFDFRVDWLVEKDYIPKLCDKVERTYIRWVKNVFGSDKFLPIDIGNKDNV